MQQHTQGVDQGAEMYMVLVREVQGQMQQAGQALLARKQLPELVQRDVLIEGFAGAYV
jgi:hypothetical protein